MSDYPQHCDECGAYLATTSDQTKHGEWHDLLETRIASLRATAEHADAFHRLYKGIPT